MKGVVIAVLGAVLWAACGQVESVAPLAAGGPEEPGHARASLVATATYDATLKAPRCGTVAGGCDTGTLVNGRAQLGPESNASNTLGGTCADGTSGSYHSDESLDRLKVYTVDGSDLAPGKQVTIEALVWAYSSYSSDKLDLYYAADASNPSWTFLTTLTPAGPGAQTLKTTYTLPTGASVQAVRAAFSYGGSTGPCSSGSYNDRDDLAFAVAGGTPPTPEPLPSLLQFKTRLAAREHTLLVRLDGTVWSWGFGGFGQLGDGTTTSVRTTPVQVQGLTSAVSVAAGGDHSLALRHGGTVWAWGANSSGQLGNASITQRTTPVQVSGLTGVTAIAAGEGHSLAVRDDGTLWAWGENASGQLGDGSTTDRLSPVQVSGLTGVVAVAAGYDFSLALRNDGTVWGWGDNVKGELGNGTTTASPTPVQVSGLTGVTAIAAGTAHALALKSDGTLWAWGYNDYSQLGDGTSISRLTPVQVSGLTGVTAIAAGTAHALALKS
ncbi:RCC1 domain-containing protein, partial [Archangium sp.]|uniref:RCC1 domain-containing protein n=1 Tax=Archangium sp. TaxID=1872627 RepID=UPI002D3F4115|nr:RCC1 repeat-containing protein [Archangium sp.]